MCSDIARVQATITNAAVAPHLWSDALALLAESVGAVGAAYFVSNERVRHVDWACLSGPSNELTLEFVQYYAAIDPYTPLLNTAPPQMWTRLMECLPKNILDKDEWYNDFVVKSGVRDILGSRLAGGVANTAHIGLHQEICRNDLPSESERLLKRLYGPLSNAAWLHSELRRIGWRSCMDLQSLDRLSAGVIISEADGRVTQLNRQAARLLRRSDGLLMRNGRLVASTHSDSSELLALIAAAGNSADPVIRRMIVRRAGQWLGYSVTVAPLSVEVTYLDRPMVMLVVADPKERSHLKTYQQKSYEASAQVRDKSTFMDWKSRQPGAENAKGRTRYYFPVGNGRMFADENGGYFSTVDKAVAYACTIARELAVDTSWVGFTILVQDEEENEIARVQIGDHAKPGDVL
jgi:PAS domain-containing protein